jgi:acyl-CoA synthetase (AMP-forming)/AMP-acid ligase II
MENNVHFMAIVWAAQAAGLAYTAVSTHLRDEEIAYIINDSHAKVLISSKALAPLALKIYPLLKNIA